MSALAAALWAVAAAGNPYLAPAIAQLDALEESAALETLEKAKAWPENSPHELAQVYLYIGLAHAGLAREAEAQAAFREALLLEPTLALPGKVPPRVRQWWTTAGGRDPSPGPAAAPAEVPPTAPDAPVAAPPLAPRPTEASLAVPRPEAPAPRAMPRRLAGGALAAVGLAATVAAVVMGVRADELARGARTEPHIGAALTLHRQAEGQALVANVLYAAGGAGLVSGALLVFVP